MAMRAYRVNMFAGWVARRTAAQIYRLIPHPEQPSMQEAVMRRHTGPKGHAMPKFTNKHSACGSSAWMVSGVIIVEARMAASVKNHTAKRVMPRCGGVAPLE